MTEIAKAKAGRPIHLGDDFQMMANCIPQLAWMARPDGWIFWFNDRWYEYTGTTPEEMQGWGWQKVHRPDHVERVTRHFQASFAAGEPWEDVFPLRSKTGEYRWFLSRALPMHDEDGNITRWFGTNTDITEQKKLEERQTLLMREVDHRAKNALAVAQAVVNLTRADTPENYKQTVEGRIASLARAHSLLAASRWEGADLEKLIHDELAPYALAESALHLQGPRVILPPSMAQSVALVLHELTTNAAKHGSLSAPEGELSVSWVVRNGVVDITWQEANGPHIVQPERMGFGTSLLRRLIADLDGGRIEKTWNPEGLLCHITIPHTGNKNEAMPQSNGKSENGNDNKRVKVLVVEDEPLTALDLEVRLEDAGYEVIGPVGSVDAAREILASARPDVALLDANLAGERSWPIALQLWEDGVKIVFCTGYEQLDDLPSLLTGCPVLTKPFQGSTLLSTLKTAADATRSGASTG